MSLSNIYGCDYCNECSYSTAVYGCNEGTCHKAKTARDAEHRAELAAAQATIEQLGKDGAALATEIERLKGELAEARGLLEERVIRETCIPCGRCITCRTLDFLSRIESTPVQAEVPRWHCNRCDRCGWEFGEGGCMRENCSMRPLPERRSTCAGCGARFIGAPPASPAPPDDIRLEESLINRIAEAKSYVLGQIGRVERVFAAHSEEAYRRLADHERRLAALETKVEPGTHAFRCKDRHSKDMADCKTEGFDCVCDCGTKRNEHPKGAKP